MGSVREAARVYDEAAPLVARSQISADTWELSLRCPRIAAAARPGQFVNVLLPSADFGYRVLDGGPWGGGRPFLIRRPFSVYRVYRADPSGRSDQSDHSPNALALLVKVVGEGSRLLSDLPVGASLKLLGPRGNGFRLPPRGAPAALVAGGCGWASLAMLAAELRRHGHPTYAFIGAKTMETLPVQTSDPTTARGSFLDELPEVCVTSSELEALGVTVALAAEEGGRVYGGLVTDLLGSFLRKTDPAGIHIYACGPHAMLACVADMARERGAPCQVAMEERMACGAGVCNSCVVEVRLPDGALGHKKLCTDGPVLDASEVNWAR